MPGDKPRPTTTPEVISSADSADVDVRLPTIKPGDEARVDVTPGTEEFDVLADMTSSPDPIMDERRQRPAATQVTIQGQPDVNGGLRGWPAQVMNMSAIAFVMLLMFIMYRDFVTNIKERDAMIRDETKMTREMTASEVRALSAAITAMTTSNNAMSSEFRARGSAIETRLEKLAADVADLAPKNKPRPPVMGTDHPGSAFVGPPGPQPVSVAPPPRAVGCESCLP